MTAAESAAPFGARDLWEEARAAEEKLRSALPWPWQTADHAELRPALERAKSVGVRSELLTLTLTTSPNLNPNPNPNPNPDPNQARAPPLTLTLTLTLILTLTLPLPRHALRH